MSLAKKIWDTMSPINVNAHIEKKGNLSYLSWTWAWKTLMENFPDSYFDFRVDDRPDGSTEVSCLLQIQEGDEKIARSMWLPVMDHRNKAIMNPNSREVSDAKMRCLVKCIATTTGLGLYIYAGEDLPEAKPKAVAVKTIDDHQVQAILELLDQKGLGGKEFCQKVRISRIDQLEAHRFDGAIEYLRGL